MAPVNFEKNIREKLQERELQPSSDSWDTLSTQLGATEQKKSGGFFWLGIAASLIGILVIAGYFLTKTQPDLENKLVKDSSSEELINTTPSEDAENELFVVDNGLLITSEQSQKGGGFLKSDSFLNIKSQMTVANSNDISEERKQNEPLQGNQFVERKTQKAVAIIENFKPVKKKQIENETIHEQIDEDALFVTNKISEVVASVQDIQSKNKEVSMEEIDALLAQAQRDIAMERILSSTQVDAQALLMDVELDLERTFRDRVFYALGEGFDYVKTTVVNGHD